MGFVLGALVIFLVVVAVTLVVGGMTVKAAAGEKKTDHVVAFSLMGLVMAVCAVALAILAAGAQT